MNILFVHDIPFVGGGELWAMRVGEQLLRLGHKVCYAFPKDSACHGAARDRGLRARALPFDGPFQTILRSWRSALQEDAIDVVLCSVMGFHREIQILASVVRSLPRPAIVLKSGTPPNLLEEDYGKGMEAYFDGFISISPGLRNAFLELGLREDLVHFLWEGVDLSRFERARHHLGNPRFDLRAALSVAAEVPMILSAGRIERAKGQHTMLQALALLHKRGCDFRCVHFGSGSSDELRALKKFAETSGLKGKIFFAGQHPDLAPYLLQGDMFVNASWSEGVPNVVTEAMAAGLAIVATDVGGTCDVVLEGRRGFLCPSQDPKQLAHRIGLLLEDSELRMQMGQGGRRFVEEVLDSRLALDALVQYLERAIRERRRGKPRGAQLPHSVPEAARAYFGVKLTPSSQAADALQRNGVCTS